MNTGYFDMENSALKQRLVAKVPSVRKHELHFFDAAGYWMVREEVAQEVA